MIDFKEKPPQSHRATNKEGGTRSGVIAIGYRHTTGGE